MDGRDGGVVGQYALCGPSVEGGQDGRRQLRSPHPTQFIHCWAHFSTVEMCSDQSRLSVLCSPRNLVLLTTPTAQWWVVNGWAISFWSRWTFPWSSQYSGSGCSHSYSPPAVSTVPNETHHCCIICILYDLVWGGGSTTLMYQQRKQQWTQNTSSWGSIRWRESWSWRLYFPLSLTVVCR